MGANPLASQNRPSVSEFTTSPPLDGRLGAMAGSVDRVPLEGEVIDAARDRLDAGAVDRAGRGLWPGAGAIFLSRRLWPLRLGRLGPEHRHRPRRRLHGGL